MKFYKEYDYIKFHEENNYLEYCQKQYQDKVSFNKIDILSILYLTLMWTTIFGVIVTIILGISISDWFWFLMIIWCLLGTASCFIGDFRDKLLKQFEENYTNSFIESIQNNNIIELKKCEQWRKTHPLEEKCRLALTNNPNYVADLIRYINKEN